MSWTTRLRGIYTGHAAEVTSQLVLRGGDRLGASPGCAARPVPKLAERPRESDTAAVPGILAWTHADPGEVVEVFVGLSGGDGSIGDVEALEDVVLDDNLGKVLLEEVVDVEAEICNVFGFEAADDVRASTARRAEVKNCGKPLTNATQHLQAFGERSFPVDSRHWRRPTERQFQAHE
jgi:hypothetical protein